MFLTFHFSDCKWVGWLNILYSQQFAAPIIPYNSSLISCWSCFDDYPARSSRARTRNSRISRTVEDNTCDEEHTNTGRNKAVSDMELKCVSRRLSIGGGCLKNQCPHLNTYGRVVFADTVLSFRSWMSRSPGIVNVSTEQNCIPPTHVWSVHSNSSDMFCGMRSCYNRDHQLVCINPSEMAHKPRWRPCKCCSPYLMSSSSYFRM